MELSAYGKGYAVFGNTKDYKEQLKALGGRYNSNLGGRPGWIFGSKVLNQLQEFVDQVNSGTEISIPAPNIPTTTTRVSQTVPKTQVPMTRTKPITIPTTVTYPNVFTAADGKQYQLVMHTVNYPVEGENVTVNFTQGMMPCTITSVIQSSGHFIVTDIKSGTTFDVKLVNGQWQIPSVAEPHSLSF